MDNGPLGTAIESYFEEHRLTFCRARGHCEHHTAFLLHADTEHCFLSLQIDVCEDQRLVLVHALFPPRVPQTARAAVMEYTTRANATLNVGNWELDLDAGLLTFKTSLAVEDASLDPELIGPLLGTAVGAVEHYHDGLMLVMYHGLSAQEAFDQTERYSIEQVMQLANELLDE